MKKTYSKPKVVIEESTITQSVASGCTISAGFYKDKCGTVTDGDFEEEILFNWDVAGSVCTTKPGNGDDDKYCYHIPLDSNRYFGS